MGELSVLFTKYSQNINKFINENDSCHAASDLRVLLEAIISVLGPQDIFYQEQSLYDKIDYLKEHNVINQKTHSLFHNIRKNTNDSHHTGNTTITIESIRYYLSELEVICNNNEEQHSIENKNVCYCDYENINIYLNNANRAVLKNDTSAVASNINLAIEEICDICFDSYDTVKSSKFEEKVSYLCSNNIISDEEEYLIKELINETNKALRSHGNMDISIISRYLNIFEERVNEIVKKVDSFVYSLDTRNNTKVYLTRKSKEEIENSAQQLFEEIYSFSNIGSLASAFWIGLIFSGIIYAKLNLKFIFWVFNCIGLIIVLWQLLLTPVVKSQSKYRTKNYGFREMTLEDLMEYAGKTNDDIFPKWRKIALFVGLLMVLLSFVLSLVVKLFIK